MKKINKWAVGVTISALILGAGQVNAANLVVNGGFETGDLTGWDLQTTGYTGVTDNTSFVSSGSYGLVGGQIGSNAKLTQTIATVAGASYTFSFDERNDFDDPTNDFQVFWNGTMIQELLNGPSGAFTTYLFNVVATGTSTEIRFGLRHDPSYLALDNVSVTPSAVPVPAAVWLFGSGIAGLMGTRRKKMLAAP
jgi:hypothetical protein